MKISLVLVTFNAERWIKNALESVRLSSVPCEVILVDNASSDATLMYAKESFPEIEIIHNSSNLGFGVANNQAISIALKKKSDYIFLLNQDAKIEGDTLEVLLKAAEKNPKFAILSPLQLTYDGERIDPHTIDYLKTTQPDFISQAILDHREDIYEVDFMPAAAWLLRADVVRKVGGFDPLYFLYGEDLDLTKRMQQRGFRVGLVPNAAAYHWHGGELLPISDCMKAREQYWQTILWIKYSNMTVHKTLMAIFREILSRSIRKFLYFDFKGLVTELMVNFKLIPKIFKIIDSRNRCRSEEGIFLEV